MCLHVHRRVRCKGCGFVLGDGRLSKRFVHTLAVSSRDLGAISLKGEINRGFQFGLLRSPGALR